MEQTYAIVNPYTNKVIQLSQLENTNYKFSHTEYVNGVRRTTEATALCILTVYTSDLIYKTYNPESGKFI